MLHFSKCDYDSLNNYFLDIGFTPCFVYDNVNSSWQLFKSIILEATSFFIPKVKLKSHQPPKWFTPTMRHNVNCIDSFRKQTQCNPSPQSLTRLHNEKQLLEALMSRAQIEYELQLFNNTSNNSKFTFHYQHSISNSNCIFQQLISIVSLPMHHLRKHNYLTSIFT